MVFDISNYSQKELDDDIEKIRIALGIENKFAVFACAVKYLALYLYREGIIK